MTGPHLTPEREADPMRAALEASTELLAQLLGRMPGLHWRIQIDERVQENQRILGLAVAEADKPHDGTER